MARAHPRKACPGVQGSLHSSHTGLSAPSPALSLQSLCFLVTEIIRALLTPVVYKKELRAYKMKSQMEPSDNRSKAQIAKGWHIYHHHSKPPCAHTGSPLCVWRQLGFSVPKQRWLRVCTAPGAGGTWLWLPEMLLTCAVPCRCVAMSLSNTGQNQPN